ncbi:JmjC domain, hydroxylase-domain-containing protein [Cokeromyces recurvatus]|uniref:JmjC domain, hydroxylase-domain-containing protein n=1 Tax=Cokeromyces recurvatus TaxID=90255 RepID=UPI00221FCCDF|nr:JmjC domain, hydroxylase-domain-containing protein [Cokeromyces recurvatus]KAI7905640.1 JmjC domain, hydroxylase-domain-containing protein [Cokeromyces recurvatus]
MDEFKDFRLFVESIDEYGKKAGIVKVIPPKEWKTTLPKLHQSFDKIKITKPITQHIIGGKGIYSVTNIENRKRFTLQEWHDLCQKPHYRPPSHINHLIMKKGISNIDNERKTSNALSLFDSKSSNLTIDDYKEIERHYWRNITFCQSIYGADMVGTLFDDSVLYWNPNTLDNTLNKLNVTLPGVNTPYLYFGMWKATFAWHVEDMDLYSINYIHFGAPKQWYVIQPCHQKRFEYFMQSMLFIIRFILQIIDLLHALIYTYIFYKSCHEFLRHKTCIVSPKVLEENNIHVQRCVQEPGEFIITYPFGYHAGYNLDFNCAESVNFALDSWLEIGRKAKSCTCTDDSVVIDVNTLFSPASDQKIIQKLSNKNPLRCVLCSETSIEDHNLLLKSTTNLKFSDKELYVHKLCAEAIHETYIIDNLVYGLEDIPASRWKLTCIFCKQKIGACMQCYFGKCWKSFHATCAVKQGATMKYKTSTKDTLIPSSMYEGYCPQHDPKRILEKQVRKDKYIQEMTNKLQIGSKVYTKWRGGGYYKGIIRKCIPSKKICYVLSQHDGISRQIPWRDILFELPASTL